MRSIRTTLLALMVLMSVASVHAVNMQFLREAPVTRLKGDEVKEFRDFVFKTLDETPQGTTVEWSARKATFNSKITPQKSAIDGGMKCRQAHIESKATDRQASGDYWFCKDDKRGWQFRTPSKNAQIEKQ